MQKIRTGAWTVFFLMACALFISSAFISILAKANTLSIPFFYWAMAIALPFIISVANFYFRPLHKKWSSSIAVSFFGLGIIFISLFILDIADRTAGEFILNQFFGGADDPSLYSFWAMMGVSIVFILIIIFILTLLSFLSRYVIFSPAQLLMLWISRWLGKIYHFLVSGCPSPAIRLIDIAILIWLMEKASSILMTSNSIKRIEGTSLINAAISNMTYIGAGYAQGSQLKEPFDGLLLNIDSAKGIVLYWDYLRENFFFAMLSNMIASIWFHWEMIIAVWFFAEVIIFVVGASRQLSIEAEDFTNATPIVTGSDSNPKNGERNGLNPHRLADLLATDLNRINELYRDVDEQRAIRSESGAGRPVEATLKSGDVAEILKSSSSEKSEIGLGPVKIPIGSITGMIGRLMQGPRIIIGMHRTSNKTGEGKEIIYLTATLSGKEPYSWIVDEQSSLDSGSEFQTVDDMISELSHRIFAKLAFEEPGKVVPWKAVWNFNEGLRAYRDCLHSVKKRHYFLKDAEKHFINAAEEEDDSINAYYNLGVVYTELKQLDSAEVAFLRAIKSNPNEWEAYYALGLNIYNKARDQEELSRSYHTNEQIARCEKMIAGEYDRVIALSDHIIDMKEAHFIWKDCQSLTKAYNLKGDAICHMARMGEQQEKNSSDFKGICRVKFASHKAMAKCSNGDTVTLSNSEVDDSSLDHSIDSCKKAVHYSWFVLFEAEFLEDDIADARKLVSECMIDLAELYLFKQQNYRAGKLLEQAISLNPSDSNLYLYLGKVNCLRSHFGAAEDIFKLGLKMAPEDARFEACLACIYNKSNLIEKALQKCDEIDIYGPEACSEALDVVAGVYNSRKMFHQQQRLENASFLARLRDDAKKGNSIVKCLNMIIDESGSAGNGLQACKRANVFITLINLLDDLESIDNSNNSSMKKYERHTNNLITDLISKSNITNGWKRAHFLYLIGYLSYIFYIYRLEYFKEARELFERYKQYSRAGRSDQAIECISKSIEFLKRNKVEDISNFDTAIEKADNYLKNDPLESVHIRNAGQAINALFNKIYLDKIRESETNLVDACNVLRCKLYIYKFLNDHQPIDIDHRGCHLDLTSTNDITADPQCPDEPIEVAPPMATVYTESYKSKQKTKIREMVDENINKLNGESTLNKEELSEWQDAMQVCEKVYSHTMNIHDDESERIGIYVGECIESLKEINNLFKENATSSKSNIKEYIQTRTIQMRYSMYIQEYSHLLIESGRLYLKMNRLEIAEKAFREAIELLEDERPQDIKRRSLWTLLSQSQSKLENRRSDALKGAQKGRMANPLGYDERRELGRIFCKLEEYDFGLQELDYAQSWKPDGPEILVEIGRSYLKQARECSDKDHRKKILKNACDRLNQALKIYDKSLIIKRGVARYWLGRVYYEMGDYKKAIPHFRIIYNVRLIETDYDRNTLVIALRLAQAYLKAKLFDDAEELFDKIIAKRNDLDDYDISDTPGEKYEDPISFREVIIKAYLCKCISCIERNGDPSIALNNAALANRYLCFSEYPEHSKSSCDGTDSKKSSSDRLSGLNADYEYCMGRIYSHMDLPRNAVDCLESSVSKRARSCAYLHLALAYESKINSCNHKQEGDPNLARKALKCCYLAGELDLKGEYEKELKELNMRLQEILADKSKMKNVE